MHHSDTSDFIKDTEELIGPTGKFPAGKIHPTDAGEIAFSVSVKSGKIIVAFGAPVAWIGLSTDQADALADLLRQRATQIRYK